MSLANVEKLIELKEKQRIAAVIGKDYIALQSLLREDLTHVHSNGVRVGKQEILAELKHEFDFLQIDRGALDIRVIGDSAIVVGEVKQRVRFKLDKTLHDVHATLTQVWLNDKDGWALAAFHAAVLQRDISEDLGELDT